MSLPDEVLRKPPYGPDLVEAIQADHAQARTALSRLVAGDPGRPEMGQEFRRLARLLSVHETAEEQIVYPLVARLGSAGVAEGRARRAEEQEAKRLLARLLREELVAPGSRRFARNLRGLQELVEEHAAAEETRVLPLLMETETDLRLRVMASLFDQAKLAAPTRPHPHGPDRATGLLLTGPPLAVIDRARDAARRWMAPRGRRRL